MNLPFCFQPMVLLVVYLPFLNTLSPSAVLVLGIMLPCFLPLVAEIMKPALKIGLSE